MSTPTYIAESSAPRYRGVLVMMYTLGTTGGQFVAGIISGIFSGMEEGWRWVRGSSRRSASSAVLTGPSRCARTTHLAWH